MSQLKIVRVPQGEAPLEIREKWVGLTLEYAYTGQGFEDGIISRKPQPKRKNVTVPTLPALEILEEKDRDAALWFRKTMGARAHSHSLVFGLDEVELL